MLLINYLKKLLDRHTLAPTTSMGLSEAALLRSRAWLNHVAISKVNKRLITPGGRKDTF